jgi:hypothetical protein
MGFLPICRRAASMPHPFGLFPTNAPVLDAANGRKARYNITSVNSKNFGVKNMFFIPKRLFLQPPEFESQKLVTVRVFSCSSWTKFSVT